MTGVQTCALPILVVIDTTGGYITKTETIPSKKESIKIGDYIVNKPISIFDAKLRLKVDLMIKRQGSSQIIMGLDDPYPLGEMESEAQSSYPGKLLDLAKNQNIINQNQYDDIWEDNVLRWLFGEDQKKIIDLTNKILT